MGYSQTEKEARMRLECLRAREQQALSARDVQFIEEWNRTHTSTPSYADVIAWADAHPSQETINKILAAAKDAD